MREQATEAIAANRRSQFLTPAPTPLFAARSLGVAQTSISEKERAFESAAMASESKIRKLTKQINKLELAAQAAGED